MACPMAKQTTQSAQACAPRTRRQHTARWANRWAVSATRWASSLQRDAWILGKRQATCAVLLCLLTAASAQTTPDPTETLRRQQERERAQREQLETRPDIHLPSAPPSGRGPLRQGETPCFTLQRVVITPAAGARQPKQLPRRLLAKLQAALAGDTGQDSPLGLCLGSQGIGQLIQRAQDTLISQGYVTSRVLAPPQDLKTGTLHLAVAMGRLGAIRLAKPEATRQAVWNTVAPQIGQPLNLRDIEQTLENLRRVPTVETDIQIVPGQAADESDLLITQTQSRLWRLNLSLDDSGTTTTGKYQGSATLSLDNLLTLSDLFYVTLNNDLGGGQAGPRGTRGHVAHYSLPLGYWSLGTTASASRYYQRVVGVNQDYIYRGTSENLELSLSRIVYRDAVRKTDVRLKAFQRRSNNYIDDTEIMVQRRVVGGWELAVSHKDVLGTAKLDSTLSYKRGTGDFDTLPAPEEPLGEGTSRFGLLLLETQLNLPFELATRPWRYNGLLRIQNNTTPLTPQDRFAIGSRYSVRGFDGEAVLSAERGWLLRNEVATQLGDSQQQAYLGLDYGEVSGPSSETLAGKSLAGVVLGLRGSVLKLQYDLFVGAPLHRPNNFKTAQTTAGFSLYLLW